MRNVAYSVTGILTLSFFLISQIMGHLVSEPISLHSFGTIGYEPLVTVNVNFNYFQALNNFSVGVHLRNYGYFYERYNDADLLKKVSSVHFGLVRIFLKDFEPAIYWNETANVGTYDWSLLDQAIQFIKSVGAEPLITIGGGSEAKGYWLPKGMSGNYMGTGFPRNESFGKYAADIVRHINVEGKWKVKWWEIWNEVWLWEDVAKATVNFTNFFNSVQRYMHEVDPSILIGNDRSNVKPFFDYFVNNVEGVGFLSFHKYDAWGTLLYHPEGYLSNSTLMATASNLGSRTYWNSWSNLYSTTEMQGRWYQIRGERLPIILSETNMNSATINGTDRRIQEVLGGVWYAEELRALILNNTAYSVYYHLYSNDAPHWNIDKQTRGFGFGMMNSTKPYEVWHPYWTNYLFGNYLHVGDRICYSSTSNPVALSSLTWKTDSAYVILLIGKADNKMSIEIFMEPSVAFDELFIYKIDRNLNGIQQVKANYSNPLKITLDSYSVILITLKVM